MAHHPLQRAENMQSEDVFAELRTRLYDLGEARTQIVVNPAAEPIQLSLYRHAGLRITDAIVELLRYQLLVGEDGSLHDVVWEDRRILNDLLDALRAPWSGCSGSSGKPTCAGGSPTCETCRYSIVLIASQLNNLALGHTGFPRMRKGQFGQGQESQSGRTEDLGRKKPDVEVVQKELTSTVSELAQAKETIERLQGTNTSTEKELKTALRKAKKNADDLVKSREQIGKMKSAYDQVTMTIKECVKTLKFDKASTDMANEKGREKSQKEVVWEVAAKQYKALYGVAKFQMEGLALEQVSEEDAAKRQKTLEQEALEYQHQYVKALMKIGKYDNAEETAKYILDQRRSHLGKEDDGTIDIFRDYCKILEHIGKAPAVEFEYLLIWHDDSFKSEKFRYEAGTNLALLKQRRNEDEEAAMWYRKVAARQLDRRDVDLAAESALKMVAMQKSFQLTPESAKMLKTIWEEGQKQLTSKPEVQLSKAIMLCGQELGNYLVSVGKYSEAKEVLLGVWKGLGKYSGDELVAKRAIAALSLVSISPQLAAGDVSELANLLTEESEHAKSPGDKKLSLQYKHQLGCLQSRCGDFQKAEKTLEAAHKEAKELYQDTLGLSNILTIQIGWDYAQAILSQSGREVEATTTLKSLWGALLHARNQKDSARSMANTVAILTIGRSYAELLIEAAESCGDEKKQKDAYQAARKVLSSAWSKGKLRVAKLVEDRNLTALTDLLWVGDSYGECLTYLRDPSKAFATLEEVLELRKMWKPDADETATTLGLLKEAREAKDAEDNLKKAAEKKTAGDQQAGGDKKPGEERKPDDSTVKSGKDKGGDTDKGRPSAKVLAASPAQPKPKPPKSRKELRKFGWLKYFAGIRD